MVLYLGKHEQTFELLGYRRTGIKDHDRLNRARCGAVGKLIYIKTILKSYLQDAKKDFRDADV
mgnify:CR=1 FL=1